MRGTETVAPYESFSPELLRVDPVALGAFIRYRFVRWLLYAPLAKTAWSRSVATPTATTSPGTSPDASSLGASLLRVGDETVQTLELTSQGGGALDVHVRFSAAPVAVGAPIPSGILRTLPLFRGGPALWLAQHAVGTEALAASTIVEAGAAVAIDLAALVDPSLLPLQGASYAMILFGIGSSLRADLARLDFFSRRLAELASRPLSPEITYSTGAVRASFRPVDRAAFGELDFRSIREDVERIFARHDFRSALCVAGVDARGDRDQRALYLGEVTGVDVTATGGSASSGSANAADGSAGSTAAAS